MKKIEQLRDWWWNHSWMKKNWKSVRVSGGWDRDYFNTTIILLIGLFNLINQILKKQEMSELIYITLPFLIASILIYNKHTSVIMKSIIFLLLGIGYQIAVPDASYIGSSALLSLSFMQHKNIKYGISISLLTLIMIAIKATKVNHSPSQLIVAVMAFTFIYGNVYLIIKEYNKKINDLHKKLKVKKINQIRNLDIIKVSEEDKAVLKMYMHGYDYAKISKFLNIDIKKESIRKKITRIRDTTECENDMQFAIWLYDIV